MTLRNEKGLTLVEVLFTTALAGVALLALGQVTKSTLLSTFKFQGFMEQATETMTGDRALFKDVVESMPSFNSLSLTDDTQRDFFEYHPDVLCTQNCPRIFTLALNGQITFLIGDPKRGPASLYYPSSAYEVGPGSIQTAGTLNFVSVNKSGYVNRIAPGIWKNGQLIMLSSPVHLYPVVNDVPDYSAIPRPLIFVGRVAGSALLPETLGGTIRNKHPINNQVINTADLFFRNLPAVGGAAPVVMIKPVTIVKYVLRQIKSKTGIVTGALFRSEFDPSVGQFKSPGFQLAQGIQSVKFLRDTISSATMSFEITKQKGLWEPKK